MSFNSKKYWKERYKQGGNSGAGSRGKLLNYKAGYINRLIKDLGIKSVLDFGCGDGQLASRISAPTYTGIDVSPEALEQCRKLTPESYKVFKHKPTHKAQLTLSVDVLYHLIEQDTFYKYLWSLLDWSEQYILIYAQNKTERTANHVYHREFVDTITQLGCNLSKVEHTPFPFDPNKPNQTTKCSWFLFEKSKGKLQ